MKISKQIVREIAEDIVQVEYNGVRHNKCDPISNEIAIRLENEWLAEEDVTVYSPVPAPHVTGGEHYVLLIPSEYVYNVSGEGYVIVDATIKQFGDEYPDIAILEPDDERIDEWYEKIVKPD